MICLRTSITTGAANIQLEKVSLGRRIRQQMSANLTKNPCGHSVNGHALFWLFCCRLPKLPRQGYQNWIAEIWFIADLMGDHSLEIF